ncbi:hypothetical protein A1O1_02249 [Capronia coronata CBS 617.96]|uniref:ATP-dependent DNA ligase family profile domain-containing protein n=1 Tax=Capronia coronata CBS 617.96 TaxID=1182541 RepID=W9YX83_9EURO|nr:uncharacterized protein A1O1_02249 [Capronia coronata CBS 617.96]EXJ93856.1 hypothetical protein A1O1_02249 [Capronia coronata CBS 617.96]
MGFKFCWLVELLEGLDAARGQKPLSSSRAVKPEHLAVERWFKEYGHKVPRHGPSAVAFLSCIFPERLSHRSYAMQETRLAAVMGRVLHLGSGRAERLRRWHESNLDFATCLQQIMAEAEMPLPQPGSEVTLEQIDEALLQVAANSPFSSPDIKRSANGVLPHDVLMPIVRRLQSREAKWLVRMILKSYSPVQVPEYSVMQTFHFLLSDILAVQNTIEAAVAILGEEDIKPLPPNPPKELRPLFRKACARYVVPRLGVMVQRQPYYKARSIHHCCQMASQRSMSVERKYDGEYCQIHIDRSKGNMNCIQIFSKSGKNSTDDRVRLHGAITAGLRLNDPDCAIKRNCIVEGELLVWSRSKKAIQPFHVIRKHVMHGLRFLGNEADSPRAPDEQLMIVFYDILLLDDKILTNEPHGERRQVLEATVKRSEGEADVGHRNVIDFASRSARSELREFFVHAINQRWEGLVLKGCKDPYFSWGANSSVIKLKKDYIAGLGDTVDLCIVGGRRDQTVVDELKIGELSWTSFHLACIENKDEVGRFSAKPAFRILDVLSHHNLSKDNILYLNVKGQFLQLSYSEITPHLDVRTDQKGMKPPTVLFKEPFVVEVMGAGFDKPSNTSYFTLRFPRALNVKIHMDRSVVETNTFDELQDMAQKTLTPSLDQEEQEEAGWLQRLIMADGKNQNIDANSQSTSPTKSTPSYKGSVGPGWRDVGVIPPTRSPEMCLITRLPDSPGVRRTLGNDPGRKPELSILASPSESNRKRRKVRRGSLAADNRLETIIEEDSRGPASARAVVPMSHALQKSLLTIPPYDPPAIFRPLRKASARPSSSDLSSHKRRPLSELSNISAQQLQKRKMASPDLAAKNVASIEYAPPSSASAQQPVREQLTVHVPKRKLCSSLYLPADHLAMLVLDSCWVDGNNDSAAVDAQSRQTCPIHRRVYIKVMNNAGFETEVAREIFDVCRAIRETWIKQQDQPEHQYTLTSRRHMPPPDQKSTKQKVVMIFNQRLSEHEFRTNPGKRHCDVCNVLMDPRSHKFFLACHFLTFEVETAVVPRSSMPEEAAAAIRGRNPGSDNNEKELQNTGEEVQNVETMSMRTSWDWDETVLRLPSRSWVKVASSTC